MKKVTWEFHGGIYDNYEFWYGKFFFNILYKHQLEFDLHVIKTSGYQWRRIWYFQVKPKSNDMKLNAESLIWLIYCDFIVKKLNYMI